MIPLFSPTVCIVDPLNNFATRAEFELRECFPGYEVKGYTDLRDFDEVLNKPSCEVPLIVVADIAAHTPNVEEGVIARARKSVPRSRGIYFSTEPRLREADEMKRRGLLADTVLRGGSNDMMQLENCIRTCIRDLENSAEYQLVKRFAESVLATSSAEERSVRFNGGEVSLPRALIEVARGTSVGNQVLGSLPLDNVFRNMLRAEEFGGATVTQAKEEFAMIVLRSGCIGLLVLFAMGVVLGLRTGLFWEILLPSSFGVLAFGLTLAAALRLENEQ